MRVWRNIKKLNIWLKIILFFCLIGFFKDAYLLGHYFPSSYAIRIFGGFGLLYLVQIVMVYFKDWRVVWFSLAHGVFALFLNQDFTFLPLFKPFAGLVITLTPDFPLENVQHVEYILISLLFSLELLKTLFFYDFLKKK